MSWKDVPRGKNPAAVVNVVIETPLGSRIKRLYQNPTVPTHRKQPPHRVAGRAEALS